MAAQACRIALRARVVFGGAGQADRHTPAGQVLVQTGGVASVVSEVSWSCRCSMTISHGRRARGNCSSVRRSRCPADRPGRPSTRRRIRPTWSRARGSACATSMGTSTETSSATTPRSSWATRIRLSSPRWRRRSDAARRSPPPPRRRSSWPRRSVGGSRPSSICASRVQGRRRRCSRSGPLVRSRDDRSSPGSITRTTAPTTA